MEVFFTLYQFQPIRMKTPAADAANLFIRFARQRPTKYILGVKSPTNAEREFCSTLFSPNKIPSFLVSFCQILNSRTHQGTAGIPHVDVALGQYFGVAHAISPAVFECLSAWDPPVETRPATPDVKSTCLPIWSTRPKRQSHTISYEVI